MIKLKTFDLSYYRGKNYFEEDGAQKYLVFQPMYKYFQQINNDYVSSWKSKGLSNENISDPSAPNNFLNPSNCECEYDKACDIGEYLDYENCKWRKKVVEKLVDECTETVEEVKLAKITLAENEISYKCSSCTVYTVLFWLFFTINVGGIGVYFVYFHWYLKKMLLVLSLMLALKQQFTKYKWEMLSKLTLKIKLIIFTTIKLIEKILIQGC